MASGTWGGSGDNKIYQVRLNWAQGSGLCQTGFHLRDLAVQDNTAETVANAVDAFFNGQFKTLLMNADTLINVDVLVKGTVTGFKKLYNNVHGTMNPQINQWQPGFLAIKVDLKTSNRSRYGQGRMFWPCRNGDYTTQETLNATGITAYQGVVDDLISKFTQSVVSNDLRLVNVHGVIPEKPATSTHPARAAVPASWYDVETVHLDTLVRHVASRMAGIGV